MSSRRILSISAFVFLAAALAPAGPALAQKAEKRNMELVGYSDLQGRSAY